jgi:outer membrane protein, heavy metal efflux system
MHCNSPTRASGQAPVQRFACWLRASAVAFAAASSASGQQPVIVRPAMLTQTEVRSPAENLPPAGVQPPAPPAAAGALVLTLADLEQIALQTNPSIARQAALVGAARGNWVQVGLPPNPSAGYLGQQLGSGGRAELLTEIPR